MMTDEEHMHRERSDEKEKQQTYFTRLPLHIHIHHHRSAKYTVQMLFPANSFLRIKKEWIDQPIREALV